MTPRLVAISGPLEGQTIPLEQKRMVLGRQEDCELRIERLEISRKHCEIERQDERSFLLRDLNSRHGTRVNGRPIRERELVHSDLLALGNSTFLFLLDDSRETSQSETGPGTFASATLERKPTEVLHLDPARVDDALGDEARLARELHTLLRLTTSLQSDLAIGKMAERLLDACFEAIPAERGAVFLQEPGLEQASQIAQLGELEPSRTVVARVLEEGVGLLCPRLANDPDLRSVPSIADTGALLAAPLTDSQGACLGALYLDRQSDGFSAKHLELLSAIAGVASLAFQNALHLRWLEGENQRLRLENGNDHDILGESPVMRKVFDLIDRVARADSTVLIQGESGTGKELVARAIHRTSPRQSSPFVAVNCATLTENLLESELFGHERGAFTGAVERKIGKMEIAHRGTLFLDEIAELPIGLQAKLLRALQEREIERLGGRRPIKVDIRLLAATHRDLGRAVEEGSFRQDLYYRLKVIPCQLPPLRDRRQDIPLLARHFADLHGEKMGLRGVGIAPEARRSLMAYDWPGNIRELGNAIERAVVLGSGDVIHREDLPDEVAAASREAEDRARSAAPGGGAGSEVDFQSALVAFKKRLILDAWAEAGQDYAKTAERLGVHVNSLHRMVRNLAIKDQLVKA